ncbi:MAG TPA: glutathione S-transferase family protein [Rhodospirillaceae bacterium]|nr:glutathione S-transferase family protein [Rhodospirillaceae bacterium]
MILIGRYVSPFVRRVAVSLKTLGIAYEHRPLSTIDNRAEVQAVNPLGRVPALILDDGEVLVDSNPILDYLDELAGPERALVPPSGAERRRVLQLVAFGLGVADKAVACFIERKLRPADKQHQAMLERYAEQAVAGLRHLEDLCADGWLAGPRLTQADITAVAVLDFIAVTWPEMLPADGFPRLRGLCRRANALPAFAETHP